MNTTDTITRQLVADEQRLNTTAELFGINFPMQLEPAIFSFAGNLSEDYSGGYWQFYSLSNGGFYMALDDDHIYRVACENGFEGRLSADALSIVACLYIPFGPDSIALSCPSPGAHC